jgi:hypothetical protein
MKNDEIENSEIDAVDVNDELYERFHFSIDKARRPCVLINF